MADLEGPWPGLGLPVLQVVTNCAHSKDKLAPGACHFPKYH